MPNFKELKDQLQSDEQFGKNLDTNYKIMLKNEQNNEKNYADLEKNYLKQYQIEQTSNMKKMFQEASIAMREINLSHQEFIRKLECRIIPSISAYTKEIKTMRDLVTDVEKKIQIVQSKQSKFHDNQDQLKNFKIEQEFKEAQKQALTSKIGLNSKIQTYALERNLEFKSLLQHTINLQMVYHSNALEKLSKLYQTVNSLDEERESNLLAEFLQE